MRQMLRSISVLFFTVYLAACSGGNELGGTSTSTDGVDSTLDTIVVLTLVDDSGTETNQISTTSQGTLRAFVTIGDVAQAGVKVDFSLPDGVGVIEITSALTDSDGIAEIILMAGDVTNAGTAEAVYNDIVAEVVFDVTVSVIDINVDVNMSPITTTPNSIGANGTAALSVTITETTDGVVLPLSEPITVDFTSDCSALGLAIIDTDVTTFNGVATATYQDQGCGREDTIRARATVGQEQFSEEAILNVVGAELGSIEFVSASPTVIALKGTGGLSRSETSSLVFIVKDVIGNVVRDAAVNFSLSTNVGGITISPETQAKTNSNGEVTVIVAAGSVPTVVIVTATLDDDPSIATISSSLSISTGIADANSFSLSFDNLAPEAWDIDGQEVNVTARLADHFNNAVPDGTVVNFSTEFGAIKPQCLTESGTCSVVWNSQSPKSPDPAFRDPEAITRVLGASDCFDNIGSVTSLSNTDLPCPGTLGSVHGNRVTIFAYTSGEESFNDANSNGRFDDGEAFTDLGEAFRDDNNDGYYAALLADGSVAAREVPLSSNAEPGGDNEEYIDFNDNQRFDAPNGIYNGTLCNDASEGCSSDLVTISQSGIILQAGSFANIGLIESAKDEFTANDYFQPVSLFEITVSDDPLTLDVNEEIRVATSKEVTAFVSDLHNGSMPSGTVISFETTNGEIVGSSSFTLGGSSAHGINEATINLKSDDESDSGSLIVEVTTPGGTTTRTSITVND